MDYKIRAATPDDHDFIYKLKAESVRPYVEKIWGWDETYQRMDFDNDFSGIEQFHVVEAAGSLAGFVQYYWNHSCLEIVEIHLRSEYQGHGIGSDIIQYLQKECTAQRRKMRMGKTPGMKCKNILFISDRSFPDKSHFTNRAAQSGAAFFMDQRRS